MNRTQQPPHSLLSPWELSQGIHCFSDAEPVHSQPYLMPVSSSVQYECNVHHLLLCSTLFFTESYEELVTLRGDWAVKNKNIVF